MPATRITRAGFCRRCTMSCASRDRNGRAGGGSGTRGFSETGSDGLRHKSGKLGDPGPIADPEPKKLAGKSHARRYAVLPHGSAGRQYRRIGGGTGAKRRVQRSRDAGRELRPPIGCGALLEGKYEACALGRRPEKTLSASACAKAGTYLKCFRFSRGLPKPHSGLNRPSPMPLRPALAIILWASWADRSQVSSPVGASPSKAKF